MHPNWKGGSKTVIICRQHDSVHREPYRLHQKSEFSKVADTKSIFRNRWHFCTPTINYQKEKLKKKSYLLLQQKKNKERT